MMQAKSRRLGRRRRRTGADPSGPRGALISRVHPEFHRHLLLVCLAILISWGLPGPYVQLGNIGSLYLTVLLVLRLGPLGLRVGIRGLISSRLGLGSVDNHYLLLGIAAVVCQLIWLFSPTALRLVNVPLLGLFTVFMAWSIVRLLRVLAAARSLDSRLLFGATAGYLLLGISGGLVLTVLDSVMPAGFHDTISGEVLQMPKATGFGFDRIAWDQNYGRLNYFAFVSLTTLGFGDITPVVPATRLACLALSVMGPLYIAVVLGVMISRFTAQSQASPGAGSAASSTQAPPPLSRGMPDQPGALIQPVPSPAPAPPDREPGGSAP